MARLVISIGGLEQGRNPLDLVGDLAGMGLDEWIVPRSPLAATGSIDRFGDTITIRGHAQARVEYVCSRCTQPFEQDLDTEFMVFCDRRGSDDESIARALEDAGEVFYHDGINIDITGPVREAIILSLPMNPLCREDCRGLCAGCGADLNVEACRCTGRAVDPRWEALNRLKDSSS